MGEERSRGGAVLVKRLYLTVEGQTEQAFAFEVLRPHLATLGVMVSRPRLTGLHARRGGRIPTGGLLNTFQHSKGDIQRWLLEDKSPDVRFSTMIDFYSLPKDFPGYESAIALRDPYEQVTQLEQSLSECLDDRRFIPYLQLHEFEALILSQPEVFAGSFESADRQVKHLASLCDQPPEQINLGQDSHPKARIKKCFPDYNESVDGPTLAADIGLDCIRAACPHFHQWLSTLERLDQQ